MSRAINIGGNQFRNFKTKLGVIFWTSSQDMKLASNSFAGGLDARHYNNAVKDRTREFKR